MNLVGILALQGGYAAHAQMLDRLSVQWKYIRQSNELSDVDGLILPGGETSTMLRLLNETGLFSAIQAAGKAGMPMFGTCAGAILLAKEVYFPAQESLGLMDISAKRNAYGRQVSSRVVQGNYQLKDQNAEEDVRGQMEMVFIRAPQIEVLSTDVKIIAAHNATPVCVQQGCFLAATFHPELGQDASLHAHFTSSGGR